MLSHDTENPFKTPDIYPALLYQNNESPDTLLDIHRKIIFPGSDQLPGCDDSNIDSELQSVSSLGKKYDWYPNR